MLTEADYQAKIDQLEGENEQMRVTVYRVIEENRLLIAAAVDADRDIERLTDMLVDAGLCTDCGKTYADCTCDGE